MRAIICSIILCGIFNLNSTSPNYRFSSYRKSTYPAKTSYSYNYGYNQQQQGQRQQQTQLEAQQQGASSYGYDYSDQSYSRGVAMPYPYRTDCGGCTGGYSQCQIPCQSYQSVVRKIVRPVSNCGGCNDGRQFYLGYGRNYGQSLSNLQAPSDPYVNIPVDIIDVDENGQEIIANRNTRNDQSGVVTSSDPYANVPIEVVDVDIYGRRVLSSSDNIGSSSNSGKPVVTTSSQSDYTVSGGQTVSNSTFVDEPKTTTFTRTFNPVEIQQPHNSTFISGRVNGEGEASKQTVVSEEQDVEVEKEKEDEEAPKATFSWFGNRK